MRVHSARPVPPRPDGFELEADALRALAHPKRLRILDRLGDRERSVTELADDLGLSLPNVSQHLRILRDRRIVCAVRTGQTVRYQLTDPLFARCCAIVREVIARGSPGPALPRPGVARAPAEILAA